jgi:hypothetical protein
MKKIALVSIFLGLFATLASAQLLIGGKASGMGGAGVANVTDLAAVYYNPAGLMKAGRGEIKLSFSPSFTDYQNLLDAYNQSTDPTSILQDNFATNLSFQGDIAGIIGLNLNKIGISYLALPLGSYAGDPLSANNVIHVNKPANALQGSATYAIRYDTVLTLGRTFSAPLLPFASLDAGINIKSVNATYGTISASPAATSAPYYKGTGSGMAFDVGARTSFAVPLVGSLAVGIAIRDIAGQIKYSRKQETYNFNILTQTITKGPETDRSDKTVNLDPVTAIGAAATIPAINLGVAADIEMTKDDTITHLGVEYPIMPKVLIARAGI